MNVSMSSDFEPSADLRESAARASRPTDAGDVIVTSSGEALRVAPLKASERAEVLAFLAAKPVHNVGLAGLVRDNGVESLLNRGRFHTCRTGRGALVGVALVGHVVLFDARSDAAIEAVALVARAATRKHLLMGEAEGVERFWEFYAGDTDAGPRLVRRVVMLERPAASDPGAEPVKGLRPATLADLPFVMTIQAEMAAEESGTNPLESDRLGFRVRCVRRVESGRAWVCVVDGRPVFKADVIAETPEAAYVEGVYVSPETRGQGLGGRCLAQMCRALGRTGAKTVCLFADERNARARRFYEAAGFTPVGRYLITYF
ncbi:MAG TPA: GNAT family N-acetyltransferase [Pyrinomonadaceae bacterium]|nr:GNAT family N-acetyltransferase [Pyrinomonadaceae bacterium]